MKAKLLGITVATIVSGATLFPASGFLGFSKQEPWNLWKEKASIEASILMILPRKIRSEARTDILSSLLEEEKDLSVAFYFQEALAIHLFGNSPNQDEATRALKLLLPRSI